MYEYNNHVVKHLTDFRLNKNITFVLITHNFQFSILKTFNCIPSLIIYSDLKHTREISKEAEMFV